MKISRSKRTTPITTAVNIFAADFKYGTFYYKISLDDLLEVMEKKNSFLYYDLLANDFNALDFKQLYGSKVVGKDLYFCQTDGKDIEVNKEMIDPEYAIEEYEDDLDALTDYIREPKKQDIEKAISSYEFNQDMLKDSINDSAELAIEAGKDFTDLIKEYEELNLK